MFLLEINPTARASGSAHPADPAGVMSDLCRFRRRRWGAALAPGTNVCQSRMSRLTMLNGKHGS